METAFFEWGAGANGTGAWCPDPGIKQKATSARLTVPT
jgi:hypothetical protein